MTGAARRGTPTRGRRLVLATGLAALAAPALAGPRATLPLLVGAPAGSGADRWARGFAPFLERHLPRTAVPVTNLSEEGGLAVLRSLGAARALAYAATPSLLARAVEQGAEGVLSRLRFLGAVAEDPVVLLAPPGTALEALRRPEPGTAPRLIALPPPTSAAAQALAASPEALALAALHFPSGAAARAAAQAGHAAAALLTLPEARPALREGRLAALGVASAERCPLLPEVPSLAEQGVPIRGGLLRGFLTGPGLLPEAAEAVEAALLSATRDPEFAAQSEDFGTRARHLGGAAWAARGAAEVERLRRRWAEEPWPSRG